MGYLKRVWFVILPLASMQAQLPPLIDREVFFGDPVLAGVQISPDGRYLSFLRSYAGALNIWVQPILDGKLGEPWPITQSPRSITTYFWSRDSRYILYAQDRDGDENEHLYRLSVSEMRPGNFPPAVDLTPREGVKVLLYGLPYDRPEVAIIGLNDRDPSLHDLYELTLSNGQLKLLYENKFGVLGWAIDAQGRPRFATKLGPEGETELYEVQAKKQGYTFTLRYKTAWDESAGVTYIPRKGRSVYLITNKGTDKTRLVRWDPVKGIEQLIHQDPEDRVDLAAAEFDPKSDSLWIVAYTDDGPRRYFFSQVWAARYKRWAERFSQYEVSLGDYSEDFRYFILRVWDDREPGQYYLWDEQTGHMIELGRSQPALPYEHLARRQPVRIPTRDGAQIPGYLTLPKGVPPQNLPAVLLVHGGPWARDYYGYDALAQFLANRGYAVLQVNFRASTGYGKSFLNAGNKEWGTGRMQHDLTDAAKHLIAQGIFDPKRVAIMGGSYGGYAALAGLTFTPELYACGVSIVGPSSIITLINSVPPYWKPAIKIFHTRVGNPDDPTDLERLKAQSPLYHVDRMRAPLFVIQGANDPRVKQQESDQIVAKLYQKGYPVAYLLAPDEGHGFRQYINRMAMMVAIEQFLGQHLGGRVQPEVREAIAQRLAALTVSPETVKGSQAEDMPSASPVLRLVTHLPAKSRWLYTIQRQGKSFTARVEHRWERTDGGRRFNEEVESELSQLRTSDTAVVDAQGMLVRYHRTQPGVEIVLSYTSPLFKGQLQAMGQTLPIEKKINPETPVYPPGSALLYYLGSLPLREGYEGQIPLFSFQKQDIKSVKLKVVGTEKIIVAGQEIDCWVIDLDSEGSKQTIWLGRVDGLPYRTQVSVMGASMIGDRIE